MFNSTTKINTFLLIFICTLQLVFMYKYYNLSRKVNEDVRNVWNEYCLKELKQSQITCDYIYVFGIPNSQKQNVRAFDI